MTITIQSCEPHTQALRIVLILHKTKLLNYFLSDEARLSEFARRRVDFFRDPGIPGTLNTGIPVFINGAQVAQVDEPRTLFIFELEAYPEAKSLSSPELRALYRKLGSFYKVADLIGTSEAFARQNANKSKKQKGL